MQVTQENSIRLRQKSQRKDKYWVLTYIRQIERRQQTREQAVLNKDNYLTFDYETQNTKQWGGVNEEEEQNCPKGNGEVY